MSCKLINLNSHICKVDYELVLYNKINNSTRSSKKAVVTVFALAILLSSTLGVSTTTVTNANALNLDSLTSADDIGQSLECVIVVVGCDGTGSVGSSGNTIIGSNNGNSGNNNNNGNEPASLTVIKQVRCELQNATECEKALSMAAPGDFDFSIDANNANPSQFSGSGLGTEVSLNAGHYVINETNLVQVENQLKSEVNPGAVITVEVSGDCNEFEGATAQGDISTGETQTCTITNVIRELL